MFLSDLKRSTIVGILSVLGVHGQFLIILVHSVTDLALTPIKLLSHDDLRALLPDHRSVAHHNLSRLLAVTIAVDLTIAEDF